MTSAILGTPPVSSMVIASAVLAITASEGAGGTRLEVTEAVLNHISGSQAGIIGVYQPHHWADENALRDFRYFGPLKFADTDRRLSKGKRYDSTLTS